MPARIDPLEVSHLLHALVTEAQAAVDPRSSPTLRAAHVRGFVQRHWRRLAPLGVTSAENLRHLHVVTRDASRHALTLDFSQTPLAGRL